MSMSLGMGAKPTTQVPTQRASCARRQERLATGGTSEMRVSLPRSTPSRHLRCRSRFLPRVGPQADDKAGQGLEGPAVFERELTGTRVANISLNPSDTRRWLREVLRRPDLGNRPGDATHRRIAAAHPIMSSRKGAKTARRITAGVRD